MLRGAAQWKAGRKIPFVTVVTDLGDAHPFWFHPAGPRLIKNAQLGRGRWVIGVLVWGSVGVVNRASRLC